MIPIVFAYGGDPVKAELVESFNQPGNVTGMTSINAELGGNQFRVDLTAALIAHVPPPDLRREAPGAATSSSLSRLPRGTGTPNDSSRDGGTVARWRPAPAQPSAVVGRLGPFEPNSAGIKEADELYARGTDRRRHAQRKSPAVRRG